MPNPRPSARRHSGARPEARWRSRAYLPNLHAPAGEHSEGEPEARKPVRAHMPIAHPTARRHSGSGSENQWRSQTATRTAHPAPGRARGSRDFTPAQPLPAPHRHGRRSAGTRCPDDAHPSTPRIPSSGGGRAHGSLGPFDHPLPFQSPRVRWHPPPSGRGLLARPPRRGKAGNPRQPWPLPGPRDPRRASGVAKPARCRDESATVLAPRRRSGCGRNQTNTDDAHETA